MDTNGWLLVIVDDLDASGELLRMFNATRLGDNRKEKTPCFYFLNYTPCFYFLNIILILIRS